MIDYAILTAKVDAKAKDLGTHSAVVMKALDAFARVLLTRIRLGFKMGKDPDGNTWAPLNKKLTRTGQPLRNTGRMQASFTARRDGDGVLVGSNLRIPGSSSSLPAVHQYGMTIEPTRGKYLVWAAPGGKGMIFAKSITIPARRMMPLTASGAVDLPLPWAQSALKAMANAMDLS